jgi:hypothetical protein
VIALNDFFPSRGIAPNAATDEQSDNLGLFQTRLRALKGYRFSDTLVR